MVEEGTSRTFFKKKGKPEHGQSREGTEKRKVYRIREKLSKREIPERDTSSFRGRKKVWLGMRTTTLKKGLSSQKTSIGKGHPFL